MCVCLCVGVFMCCVFYCHFLWKVQDKVCFNLDLAAFPNLTYQNFDEKIYREKFIFVFKLVFSHIVVQAKRIVPMKYFKLLLP